MRSCPPSSTASCCRRCERARIRLHGVIGLRRSCWANATSGRDIMKRLCAAITAAFALTSAALAADFPAPKQGQWIARDFKFHTGETMAELRLSYTTVGEPTGEPVLLLHGTGGSGTG